MAIHCEADHSCDSIDVNRRRWNQSVAGVKVALDRRVMRTKYRIDGLQETYFVISNHEALLDFASIDFASAYEAAPSLPTCEPDDVIDRDTVLTDRTMKHDDVQRHLAGVLK